MSNRTQFFNKDSWSIIEENLPQEIKEYNRLELDFYKNHSFGKTLDVGSGKGRIISSLMNNNNTLIPYAIDIDDSFKIYCETNYPNLDFRVMSILNTNFKNDFFNTILLSFNLLGNLDNSKTDAIKEIKRILQSNGNLLLTVYSENAKAIQEKTYENIPIFSNVYSDEKFSYATRSNGLLLKSERFSISELEQLFSGFKLDITKKDFAYFIKASNLE